MSGYPALDKTIYSRRYHKNLMFFADYENAKSCVPRFSKGSKSFSYMASRGVSYPACYFDSNGKLVKVTTSNIPLFTHGFYDTNGFNFAKGYQCERQRTNALINGAFDSNSNFTSSVNSSAINYSATQRYNLYVYSGGSTARTNNSISDNSIYQKSIQIEVTDGGSSASDIQLMTANQNLSVTLDQWYTLSFFAYSNVALNGINVSVRKGSTPYTNYGLSSNVNIPANKWVRVILYFQANVTANDAVIHLYLGNLGTFVINLDLFQFETGRCATSPIPTTTASLIRNGDILYYNIPNNMARGESTIYFNIVPFYEADTAGWMPHIMNLFFCNGGQGRWIWLGSQNGRQIIFKPNGEASPNCYAQDYSLDWNPYDNIKLTCRCKHTPPYVSLFKNNVKSVYDENDDNFDDIPAYAPNFFIGNANYTTTNHFLGIIKQAAIFDRALSDSEILNIVNNGLRVSA